MSAQENADVLMGGDEVVTHGSEVETTHPKVKGPRVLIPSVAPIPVRLHLDSQTHEAPLDWAADKESEIAAKQKKARRKELKKQKLADSQSTPMTATGAAVAKPTPRGRAVALATKKPEKVPADASAPKATTGGKKRKMSVVGDKGPKKQVASTNPASASSGNVKTVPPVKRKDMSQEQRTALNKAKREAQKKKRRENKVAEKQPVAEAEGDEADAAAKVEKTKALREYLLPNFYVTCEITGTRRQIRLDLSGWPDSLGQSPVPFLRRKRARVCARRKESQGSCQSSASGVDNSIHRCGGGW